MLCCLGHGADGKALLVANKHGEVGVLKLLAQKNDQAAMKNAEEEAAYWREIYSKKFEWCKNVRVEMWMVHKCV